MLSTPAAATFLVFFSIILFLYGLQYREKMLEKVLDNKPERKQAFAKSKSDKVGLKILAQFGKLLEFKGLKISIERELAQADILLKEEEFLGLVFLLVLGVGSAIYFLTNNLLSALTAAVLGGYLPLFYIRINQKKRQAKFNSQICDALVIMSNSLRSGFSFIQAMDIVRREMPNPISKEFGMVLTEMNWGSSTEAALHGLAERVKSDDLDLVITAVLIQREVGGNLAEILDNIAYTIKERIRIKGEIRTLTAQGRISGFIIGLLPFVLAFIIYLLNPDYLSLLFTTKTGIKMLITAIFGQILGVLIIRKFISIEV